MAGIRLAPGATVTFFGAVDPGGRQRRRHLGRLLRRPARHPARLAQGDARTPSTRPRVAAPAAFARTGSCAARTRSSSPGSARGRPARPGPNGVAARPARGRPAGATGRARAYPAVIAGVGCAGPLTARGPPCYAIVTGWRRAVPLRAVCKRFYVGPGSLIAEADIPVSARPVKWRRAMALNSKRRIAALTGVLAVALTATACGSSDDDGGGDTPRAAATAASTVRPTRRSVTSRGRR